MKMFIRDNFLTLSIIFCRNKDSTGWQLAFTSPYIEQLIERVALNAKLSPPSQGGEAGQKMLAISYASHIRLWGIAEDGSKNDIGESV